MNFLPVDTKQKDMMAEPFYFFSDDGTLAFLTTRATRDEKDGFTFAQKSVDRLREIVADVGAKHAEVRIGITGIPVLENDEMASTESDSKMAGWLALGGILILYLAVYRTLHPADDHLRHARRPVLVARLAHADRRPPQHPQFGVRGHADRHGDFGVLWVTASPRNGGPVRRSRRRT